MPGKSAAMIDVRGADDYVEVVESSTSVQADAGFETEGFIFREAVSQTANIKDSDGDVYTSGFPMRKFLCLIF